MDRRFLIQTATASFLLSLSFGALALPPITQNITVSASIPKVCQLKFASGTTVDFGTYDPSLAQGNTALQKDLDFEVKCNQNTSYNINLDKGTVAAYTGPYGREMTGPGDPLQYDLFKDAAYSTVWTDGTFGTGGPVGPETGDKTWNTYTIYGEIKADQWHDTGAYTDTVLLSISYPP